MNENIFSRKSVRKYKPEPLSKATLEDIRSQISSVTPLFPNIQYPIDLYTVAEPKKEEAPHYLIFGCLGNACGYENIGFVGQQLNLYFAGQGIGACWRMAKPTGYTNSKLSYAICMSFGVPAEPVSRELAEFKRKPRSEVCEGEKTWGSDFRLDAARYAPSALNSQNWYFLADEDRIHCYRKRLNPVMGRILNRLNCIDMGIALCHIAQASESFHFAELTNAPKKKGYIYMGTATS